MKPGPKQNEKFKSIGEKKKNSGSPPPKMFKQAASVGMVMTSLFSQKAY